MLVLGAFAVLAIVLAVTASPWYWLGAAVFVGILVLGQWEQRRLDRRIRELGTDSGIR